MLCEHSKKGTSTATPRDLNNDYRLDNLGRDFQRLST